VTVCGDRQRDVSRGLPAGLPAADTQQQGGVPVPKLPLLPLLMLLLGGLLELLEALLGPTVGPCCWRGCC
jgi:hypothetical protein